MLADIVSNGAQSGMYEDCAGRKKSQKEGNGRYPHGFALSGDSVFTSEFFSSPIFLAGGGGRGKRGMETHRQP
jgi:hypothetical protein